MPKIEPSTALSSLRGAREGSEQPLPVKPACRFFCAARQLGMPAQRSHGELPPPAQLHHARDRPAQRTVSVGQGAGVNGNLIAKVPRAKTTPPASPHGVRHMLQLPYDRYIEAVGELPAKRVRSRIEDRELRVEVVVQQTGSGRQAHGQGHVPRQAADQHRGEVG